MFVKFKASGEGTSKYVITFLIIKIIFLGLYVFDCLIPFGKDFIMALQDSLNTNKWDLMSLVIPVGWMLLYYFILEVLLFGIAYLLFKRMTNKLGF